MDRMNNIELMRQQRWEILYKLYEYYKEQPGESISAGKICEDLSIDCESKEVKAAFVYLQQKDWIHAVCARGRVEGVRILKAQINATGIELVEDAIETHQASLKKKPIGFGAWHIAETGRGAFAEGKERENDAP